MRIAGIELGGTKSIAVLANGREIVDRARWPTTSPDETLPPIVEQIARWHRADPIAAIGIASFGPLVVASQDSRFGRIVNTPKPGWSGIDLCGTFANFGLPIGLDTDVAGAALAEGRWGAAQGCGVCVYLTIGTGVGGGVVVGGKPVHGRVHPELGHVRVRRDPADRFPGICPIHGDCIEGLVSGPAIAARAGRQAGDLPADHPIWDRVASELAELMAVLILALSPGRILIGGGVGMGQPALLPAIRARTAVLLVGYPDEADLDAIIVPPALGAEAGPLGALALAMDAL